MSKKKQTPHSRTEVVDAALAVVDQAGLEGLTIRGVSSASKIPTMTLYAFFHGKEELLEMMAERVTEHFFASAARPTWQASLEGLCHHGRATVLAHPGWLPLLGKRELVQPSPLKDHIVASMVQAGAPERTAAAAVVEGSLLALGFAQLQLSFASGRRSASVPSPALDWDGTFTAAVARWLAGLAAEQGPSAELPHSVNASTASPPPGASRNQVSSERVAVMAVTIPRVETTTRGAPPESGNARMPPGCTQ
jgi:AcrR family transcriptional regulator